MSQKKIYPDGEQNQISKNLINIGIDLGTTYTLMATVDSAYVDFEKTNKIPVQFIRFPQYSPFELDQVIEDEKIASIVAFYKGKPYVGNNLYHLKGHPEFIYEKNMFYHWKVEMGVDHHPLYANAISEKLDMPYKIAGGIMNYMRRVYNDNNNYELPNTTITVPASFQANQRKDTLKAAKMAKINTSHTMLVDEPNAAFLGYFNRLVDDQKEHWAKEVKNKNVLVVDFGGGTLDLSLLNVDFKRDTGITISNRAISRYNDLGGQDLDLLIAEEYLLPKVEDIIPNFDSLDISDISQKIVPQLCVIAEDIKKSICDAISLKAGSNKVEDLDFNKIQVSRNHNNISFLNKEYDLGHLSISGEDFRMMFLKIFRGEVYKFKYYDKTIRTISSSISEIIEKADETLDAIDFVLLVGGSSFNPLLGYLILDKLTNASLLSSPEPDKLVAEGAAVYSYFINQHGTSLISPITSDNIGVTLKGNRFYPIIERGKSLPQKVNIPDFKLQSNMLSEIIVPVCINGADFPIGEINCKLDKFYDIDTIIKIEAEITIDKVFKMQVIAEDKLIGEAEFENPYAVGKLTEEQLEAHQAQSALNEAKQAQNVSEEKRLLRTLISKHSDADNHFGVLENAETYIKRFDDQDSWIWNMMYISNKRLGRLGAAKKALDRAIEINREQPALRYNYALLLEETDEKFALEYLEKQSKSIKENLSVRCKIALLKSKVNSDTTDLHKIAEEFKNNPGNFSDFDRRVLLKEIFKQLNEPYSYIDPKTKRKNDDESKYLDMNNLPF